MTLDQIRDLEWGRRYANVEEMAEWIGDDPDAVAEILSKILMAGSEEAAVFGVTLLKQEYDAYMRERVRDPQWLREQEENARAASLELVRD